MPQMKNATSSARRRQLALRWLLRGTRSYVNFTTTTSVPGTISLRPHLWTQQHQYQPIIRKSSWSSILSRQTQKMDAQGGDGLKINLCSILKDWMMTPGRIVSKMRWKKEESCWHCMKHGNWYTRSAWTNKRSMSSTRTRNWNTSMSTLAYHQMG